MNSDADGTTRRIRPVRLDSIDVLRSAAIVLMVVVHFVENLSGRHGGADPFADGYRAVWLPTGFAAPIFSFLTGLNYRLWADGLVARGVADEAVSKATVRRGLFLIGLGFAFNVLVWLPEDTFNWDILTFIGASLILLDVVRKMPSPVPLGACVVVLATAPVLRTIADYPAFWKTGWFDYDWTLGDVLLGFLVVGYFPIVPWILMPVAGYIARDSIVGTGTRSCPSRSPIGPLVIGAAFLVASMTTLAVRPLISQRMLLGTSSGWTMFPPSTAYLLGPLGITILAATLLHRLMDCRESGLLTKLTRWTRPLSRHALSVYLLHHVVHVWPMWIAGLRISGDVSAFWQVAVPPGTSLVLAFLFLVAVVILFEWIDRRGLPSVESLMRWLCDEGP
ncbi:MAG: heparan-alpha-glucosaminide N-acetyltransferase domain-containing protein [Planctomycetaceae bacterium]